MKKSFALLTTTALCLLPGLGIAAPKVVTDIAPVQSLVAQVMDGLADPEVIVGAGQSAHHLSLRPSQARALAGADLIVMIGDDLTPWLTEAAARLNDQAPRLSLLLSTGTAQLPTRDNALFEHEEHDDHETHADNDEHDHQDHDDHDDHADMHGDHKDDHVSHHEHEEDHHEGEHETHDDQEDHAGHNHGDTDPHAWLSPQNAKTWLGDIALMLSRMDPENAATYEANATAGIAQIDAALTDAKATLSAFHDAEYLVGHDAFQYFEHDLDLHVIGAIAADDATRPGAARLAEVQALLKSDPPRCVLADPEVSPALIETVAPDVPVAWLDPLGNSLEQGKTLYPALITEMARKIADCAG